MRDAKYCVSMGIKKNNISRIYKFEMRMILALTVILLQSFGVQGQTVVNDSVKATSGDLASHFPVFPLVVVNDKVYDSSLGALKNKIKHIQIYKGQGASAIFGIRAAHGVIIIGTQNKVPKYFIKPSTDTVFNGPVVYIINGNLSEKKEIIEKDVLEQDVISYNQQYSNGPDSIVSIVTSKFAIEQYKKKLSDISKKYMDFLDSNQNDDKDCGYILNGVVFWEQDKPELIKKLYAIDRSKIKFVDCMENSFYNGGASKKEIVVITTKK